MKYFLILVLFLSVTTEIHCQDLFKVHSGWTDVSLWYKAGSNTKIGGDFGYRTTLNDLDFHQTYYRPTVKWQKNPLYSLSLAVSNFHTFNDAVDLSELRFAQQGTLKWPQIGVLRVTHRLRFEQRLFFINLLKENNYRGRYQLELKSPRFVLFGLDKSPFFSNVSWEAFINMGSSYESLIGNSHRYAIVFGNRISKKLKVALHYYWQTVRANNDEFILKENVIRLRFNYTFNP